MRNRYLIGAGVALAMALSWADARAQLFPLPTGPGTIYFGVFGHPYNGSRGWLLHFSQDLNTEYTPGAFGWDQTAAIVPASMVPAYHGGSSYLIFSK